MRILFLLLALTAVGCPTSDDLDLTRNPTGTQDLILPQGDAPGGGGDRGPGPDTPMVGPDVPVAECQGPADCSYLNPKACQVAQCVSGKCELNPAPNGSPCDDGDACTITSCSAGACSKTGEMDCEDDNPCTGHHCDKITGCMTIPTIDPCDDGDPCTEGDQCSEGVCKPGTLVCALGTIDNPAQHCSQIKSVDPAAESGVYWVVPVGGGDAIQVYCEMTVAGGGWTRIGLVTADTAICSYEQGFGNPAEVLGAPAQTTVLPSATVETIPRATSDLLVSLKAGTLVFRSASPQFGWSGVADGTINSVTLVDYNVTASINGGSFETLSSPGLGQFDGPALLYGVLPNGQAVPALGLGAQETGEFVQDAACAGAPLKGFWGGQVIGPPNWQQSGTIYIR